MKTFKVLVSWSRDSQFLLCKECGATHVTVKAKDEEEAKKKAELKVMKQEGADYVDAVEWDEVVKQVRPKRSITVKQGKGDNAYTLTIKGTKGKLHAILAAIEMSKSATEIRNDLWAAMQEAKLI